MARILVLAGVFMGNTPGRNRLVEAGFDVADYQRPGPLPEDELIAALQGFEGVVAGNDPMNDRVMRAAPSLRAIARHGVGLDSVDLEAAARLGIIVTNTPGIIIDSVADMAFALILAVARRVCEADRTIRAGRWIDHQGVLVWGKTLGIVGVGAIGMAMARRALGFNMTVLAFDPFPRPDAEELGVRYVGLDELLREADFVSIHAPLNEETRGMLGERELGLMRPSAYLINTARGGLVDQKALYEALREGRIAGAGLDVLAEEPPSPDDPLLELANCVFTPHSGHNAREIVERVGLQVAGNLIETFAFLGGACPDPKPCEGEGKGAVPPRFCANPRVLERYHGAK
jgi:D-3-phosphoglycerate dehydrogenase